MGMLDDFRNVFGRLAGLGKRVSPEPRRMKVTDRKLELPPLELRWGANTTPLPIRAVRRARGPAPGIFTGQPWFDTGPHQVTLDFSARMRRLIDDVVRRRPEWSHLKPEQILIGFTQANLRGLHGLQARVTPLRFADGELRKRHRGFIYQIQRYFNDETEYLYLLTFCLPRFLDQDFDHKMVTLFHELYHIGPKFDGDLRRHEGRYHIHSHSKCDYDRHAAELARSYLAEKPDPRLSSFLRLNFEQLHKRHGKVVGIVVPRPRLVPLAALNGRAAARHADENR
jgi:hypothetical protein